MTSRIGDRRDSKGSCSNDYVQKWLEKTQRRPAWEPSTKIPQDMEVPWRPHNLEAAQLERPHLRRGLRNGSGGSLDSSIIPEKPTRAVRPGPSNRPSTTRPSREKRQSKRPRSSDSVSPARRQPNPTPFERQARHKTKPDRYQVKKRKNTENGDGEQKARRTKARETKKLVSSRDVMDSFTSDAILARGRLTVGNI
ncbi:uncharacterized protein DNG_00704 [Cephalotrichum gorgonifer]|uniref:Uncharacterized protein n=1 Tax=Cephalotrichum gorgonifer TaxID=2041049 RepID=A0AAE8MPS1_9PEZI|nr:uncharacterized protein DNG_00704 [Cephalotrichum gorgonifer]